MTAQLIPDRPAPLRAKRPRRTYAAAFMYDEPGPVGRRRILIGSIVSVVAIAAVVGYGLWQFGSHGQLDPARWAPFTEWPIWQYLLVGLLGTLEAAAIVAVLGGQVVGYALGAVSLTLYANGPVLELQELMVAPELRGRGIGRRLVGAVLECALAAGCAEATVPTRRARDFYVRLGFEETAVYLKRRLSD